MLMIIKSVGPITKHEGSKHGGAFVMVASTLTAALAKNQTHKLTIGD